MTLDFDYETEIIRNFARLVKGGYIYHGLKPINWCINCETALAEAEVEYEDRLSPSVYVKFKLAGEERLDGKGLPSELANLSSEQLENTYFAIWTTTPWTIISNVAIAIHPEFKYAILEVLHPHTKKEILILSDKLVETVMQQIKIKDYRKIAEVKGVDLENLKARHPFLERDVRLVLADYVSELEGTGCVHIAPGHGQEDYLTGLKYKLPVIMPVDEKGIFDKTCLEFSGLQVFQAEELIIDKMRQSKSLLYAETIQHSYPHCWRCKEPLITRSTRQWFINIEHRNLRERALKVVKDVQWIPQDGLSRISGMIKMRPDWCLSRQRFWGVPIPVFYCKSCGKEILKVDIIERFARIVSRQGTDTWFTKSTDEFLGKGFRCPVCKRDKFIKEEDIIDVWFDSGVSHQAVLARNKILNFPASLYLEGSDQHRGWFQTSLLTSIPLKGRPPYKKVLTHGFVVDGEGRKMSKSRGNVISPQQVIEEYGAEILRLWVASCDYTDDVRISSQILTGISDAYRKIRNTLRFLIGNLYDFTPEKKVRYSQLWEMDRWALSSLARLLTDVTYNFEQFNYFKIFRRLYNFCVNEMSSFYLDVLKDRLYTFGKDSLARHSAQTAIYEILTVLTKVLAPILTFTAEEVWGHLYKILGKEGQELIILNRWPKVKRKWINPALERKIKKINQIRDDVLKAIENERSKGIIHSSLEARVYLYVKEERLSRFLDKNLNLLLSTFIVSDVSVEKVDVLPEGVLKSLNFSDLGIKVKKIDAPKCQRCWNYRPSVGQNLRHPLLCQRCVEVIERGE